MSCSDTTTLAPPAGLAANLWSPDPVKNAPVFNSQVFCDSGSDKSVDSTPKTSISAPRITRPAPSHNYPNLSQQLEDFLWSRKNSYAGTLTDSIYDGDQKPVVEAVSRKNNSAGAVKKRFLCGKPHFTRKLTVASRDDSDGDTWSLSSVLEDGDGGKESSLRHVGAAGHLVVVQTTEITVEFE
jgi:hypothetical protein